MAHPLLSPSRRGVLMGLGLAGALLVPAGPAAGQGLVDTLTGTVDQACEDLTAAVAALTPGCEAVGAVTEGAADALAPVEAVAAPVTEPVAEVVESAGETAGAVTDAVTDAAAPVTEPVSDAVDAVTEPVAEEAPADPVGDAGPPPAGEPAAEPGSDPAPSPVAADDDVAVGAAGRQPTEVTEPRGPAAGVGRGAGGPRISPGAYGVNAPGIASDSGLTLQPYDEPLVSVPVDVDAPQVAGAPVTTSSPVAAMASELVSFAGDAVLPYRNPATAWVTAAGLGLLGVAGFTLRRRLEGRLELVEQE
ncbi:hypothetical protein [Euzebya sp.]|uniref:hypothetical protein n=1 Tax=Euzebya sp. TaxID=1971409 RepID=UPI003512E8C3